MKTTTFFVLWLLFLASLPCIALNYTITFTGSGASTTVGDVVVQNLTKSTSVTVPVGNVLNLTDVTAIENLSATDETIRVYPNSVGGTFTLSFFSKQAGSTQINVFSLDGRKVVGLNQDLYAGNNLFQLKLNSGSYAIHVFGNGYSYITKMINHTGAQNNAEIAYMGTKKTTNATLQKSKSTSNGTTTMLYTAGDQLLFKGISGDYSTIVTDKPTSTKTINFEFAACTDADGNNYTIVTIGTQTWMVENLKTAHYRNNDPIANVTDHAVWKVLSTGAWCDYDNIVANGVKYGHLYNWYAIYDNRNIAPVGWHVPTDAEWTTLTDYVTAKIGFPQYIAKPLAATTDWLTHSSTGTVGRNLTLNNSTGFSALPGGYRMIDGTFSSVGSSCFWWSTSETDNYAWIRFMHSNTINQFKSYSSKTTGFSVRCVRDN